MAATTKVGGAGGTLAASGEAYISLFTNARQR